MTSSKIPKKIQSLLKGFDTSSEHIVLTDKQGIILYGNQGAQIHTGYCLHEMLGKTPGKLWGGNMPVEFYQDMWQSIAVQKQAFLAPMYNKTKEGEGYWQEVHIIPVLGKSGEAEYFLALELSLDNPQRREELLAFNKNHREQPSEFRVQWPAGWLLEEENLSSDHLHQLEQHYGMNEDTLETLVASLIVISNINFAAREKPESYSPYQQMERIIEELSQISKDKKIRLKGDESVRIYGNKKLFYEYMSRVVFNALCYTHPQGGFITITVQKNDAFCQIKCEDNGIGIAEYEGKNIYDKYYRGVRARKVYPSGVGLGLYIVKTISTMMKWDIRHVSQKDVGTLFEVMIPMEEKREEIRSMKYELGTMNDERETQDTLLIIKKTVGGEVL